MVVNPLLGGTFVHEAFGHMSEADDYMDNEQMKNHFSYGKVLGSPLLNIFDSGIDRGSRGYLIYDDEGVKTEKTYLLKDGILVGRLHNRESAGKFGEKTFDIIEQDPKSLLEIKGIGTKRVLMIIKYWGKHKEISKIKDFLKQHDLSPALAEKIYRKYKDKAISLIRTNPYCLCDDALGISFISADKIALRMEIGEKHPLRVDAINFHNKQLKLSKNNNKNKLSEQKERIAPYIARKRR